MPSHDPLRNLTALREHLACHDKPIAFLFGAGTSSGVKKVGADGKPTAEPLVPATAQMTEICGERVRDAGAEYANAWTKLVEECNELTLVPNIENLLSRVRAKLEAMGADDVLVGLEKFQLENMEQVTAGTIAQLALPPEDSLPATTPHEQFARWIVRIHRQHPIEIFTTNYDMLFERALELEQRPFFDGFVGSHHPFFDASTDDLPPWTRLWKVHGSVNWGWHTDSRNRQRIVRVEPRASGEMILPSHRKYDESRKLPYLALLDRLTAVVGREDNLMIVVGYSFGDQHINDILFQAIERPSRSQLVVLAHSEVPDENDLARRAQVQPKVTILGPETALIGAQRGTWRLTEPVDDRTAAFMDLAFDSDAVPEGDRPALTGKNRLGDFNYFCKYLLSLEG